MEEFLTFDTELASIIVDDGQDWATKGPFDFSVAATCDGHEATKVWVSQDERGTPLDRMTQATALSLLQHLREVQQRGTPVISWNGLGFDLRWLGHAAGDLRLAAEVALDHYDPMFQFFCQRGFPVSLAKVAEGLGVEQKKTMSGKDAPIAWQAGRHAEVMKYVQGDAQITSKIIRKIQTNGGVRWRTLRGGFQVEPMPSLTRVRDLIKLPTPDQSWMSDPIPKAKFHDWMPKEPGAQ